MRATFQRTESSQFALMPGPDIPDAEWSKLCAYLEPY
jgi:hypothetical protein